MGVLVHEIAAHGQHDVVALVSSGFLLYSSNKLINARLQQVSDTRCTKMDVRVQVTLCLHRNKYRSSLHDARRRNEMTNLRVVPKLVVVNVLLQRATLQFIEAEPSQRTIVWIKHAGPNTTTWAERGRRLPHKLHGPRSLAQPSVFVVDAGEEQRVKSYSCREQCCLSRTVTKWIDLPTGARHVAEF